MDGVYYPDLDCWSPSTPNRLEADMSTRGWKRTLAISIVAILVIVVVGWRLTGISDPSTDLPFGYAFVRETPAWNPEVWVNGQPVLRFEGNASGIWDITQFVTDGENEVRIDAVRNPVDVFGPKHRGECSLKLMRYKRIRDAQTELASLKEPRGSDRNELTLTHRLTASVPLRWRWQDADDLVELSQSDRDAMIDVFHRFAEAYKAFDADAICALCITGYPGNRPPLLGGEGHTQNLRQAIKSNIEILRNCELIVTPDEEIRFAAGTKVVMMFRPGTEERFAGPAPRSLIAVNRLVEVGTNQPTGSKWETHVDGVVDTLLFVREGGIWRMLAGG